jgi:hypothetical protein
MLNQWITALLGLVVVAVPFLSLSASTVTWTLVVVGLIITANAMWGVFVVSEDQYSYKTGRHA